VSPYAALMTGPTTVANLFGHMGGRVKGLVQIWDVVGFDEVADLEKMPKEVITTMKTYCESGSFQRGQEAASGDASIALFGNTQQAIDIMVQTGHLFEPMPEVIRDDMAFIDRLHFYLPGWEIPQMRNELFTDHYGFVVDYLAEALREMRKHNFTEIIDRYFSMGAHLNARDRKAVRKTVSGLMKVLFPHGDVTQEQLNKAVVFRSTAHVQDFLPMSKRDILKFEGGALAWQRALSDAGIALGELSLVETHDCFTVAELIEYEAMGLVPEGQGARAIKEGMTAKDGALPINPSGGLKAKGHPIGATGVSMHALSAMQLAGTAGGIQVKDATLGGIFNMGGAAVANYVSVLERIK